MSLFPVILTAGLQLKRLKQAFLSVVDRFQQTAVLSVHPLYTKTHVNLHSHLNRSLSFNKSFRLAVDVFFLYLKYRVSGEDLTDFNN